MTLRRSRDVTFTAADTVFRQSWRVLAVYTATLVAGAALFLRWAAGPRGSWAWGIGAAACLLWIAGFAGLSLRRARRSSSWLLAFDSRRVLVKASSFLNTGPSDLPDVFELRAEDVAAVRAVTVSTVAFRVHVRLRSSGIELLVRPGVSLEPLRALLRQERSRSARGGLAFLDQAVAVVDDETIRLTWYGGPFVITPSRLRAITLLGREFPVRGELVQRFDFGQIGRTLDPADAARQVRLLMAQGDRVDARAIATRVLNWSDAELERVESELSAAAPASSVRERA